MSHREYIREIAGSDTAVLCIHGILGSPDHFSALLRRIPQNWSVCNILLDGHGKTVRDFSRSSMQKWEMQVKKQLSALAAKYQNIVIAAHSMGTLLAIDAARTYPEQIKLLFLLAVPLKARPTWGALVQALQVAFSRPAEGSPALTAAKAAYSIAPDKRLWRYIAWIPRYLELLQKIKETRNICSDLSVPCCAVQSKNDELVSPKAFMLLQSQPQFETYLLKNSSHGYYPPADFAFLADLFEQKCRAVR